MRREAYDSLEPVEPHEILEGLQKLADKIGLANAEATGLSEKLKTAKSEAAAISEDGWKLIRASGRGDPVYRKKNGELTTEPPDSQLEMQFEDS